MNIKRVRKGFLILIVTTLLAIVLLILDCFQFSNVADPSLLLAWKNIPFQEGVRGVASKARERIPDQSRELVETKLKHLTFYQDHRKLPTPDSYEAHLVKHSRNHKKDGENEDNLEYDEARILRKADKYSYSGEDRVANSDVFIEESWVAEHHLDNASKMAFNQFTDAVKSKEEVVQKQNKLEVRPRFPSGITVGRKRTAAILKEDVVLKPLAKYTNMPFVSELEFLQLKEDGVLRRNISRTLFNMAPEPFLKTPLTFSGQTRSPCWFLNDATVPSLQRMRCLPYFYLIGMPKCGTTDLYDKITSHPSAQYIQRKEPHWWTRERFGRGPKGLNNSISYDRYLHHFDELVNAIHTKGRPERMIAGDGSASTMWQHVSMDGQSDNHGLPEVLHELQPEVKLIAILREPVQRSFSDYLYFHHNGVSAKTFHNLVLAEIIRFTKCCRRRSPRYCAARNGASSSRPTLGLYSIFLVDWLKVFPRDQILILRLRDWNANCLTLLPKIYEFLELETLSDDFIGSICTKIPRNVNLKKKIPMLNQTAKILTQFYKPYNEDLAALLKDDSYLWLD